jgi:hypothetical protein
MLKAANRDARYCYTKALAARERGLETKNPGSLIVDPMSRIIAGPMGAEEGILCADCNLELGIQMKLRHDFAGHYNRPDIFQLHVNRAAPQLYHVHNQQTDHQLFHASEDSLPAPVARLAAPDVEPSD